MIQKILGTAAAHRDISPTAIKDIWAVFFNI